MRKPEFKKRSLSLLLALLMIFSTMNVAFAAGFPTENPKTQTVESELIAQNGKLRGKLRLPKEEKPVRRMFKAFARMSQRAPAKAPAFNETTVKVNIAKHGIGTNDFNFDAVFGDTPDTKVTLVNWDTDETQEATFNKDTQSVTFDNPVSMEDMTDGVYGIEFEGTNVAGKITFDESSPDYSGGSNITIFTLDLYQVRNTDVIVKTVDANGTEATNPTTTATGGKIKLTAGKVTETIDIPEGNDATETVKNFNTRNKDEINNGLNFTIEGTENGVLVDKANKKVYKPEVKVDPDGLKPTEIKFTEKPIVTETEPKIDNPENPGTQITDPDYVAVTFAQGKHGTIKTNKTYYVFKGVEMKAALGAPDVTPNKDWKHTGWNPVLATKYDSAETHVAQYKYTGDDVVPQKPGEDKPEVPTDFVLVEFKQGDHGTLSGTTKYWVNPTAKKKVSDLTKPTVKANDDWKHTGWDKADTEEIKAAMDITAQYKKKVVTTDPQDKENYAHVTFATTKGTVSGTKEYWVLKNEKVTFTVPTVDLTGVTDYTFKAWNPVVAESYAKDTVHNATFNYTGSDIVPQPGDDKPDVPADFVLVEFNKGAHGEFAEGAVTKYWVNPEKGKTLKDVTKPSVTPAEGYKHTGWDKADTEAIGKGGLTVTAQYKAKVVTTDPQDKENYAHVTFATTKGTVSGTKEYWVLKNEKVTFTVPTVDLTGVTDYTFKAWNPVVAESYAKDTVHNATFNYTGSDIVPQPGDDKPDVPADFVLVEFNKGAHGEFAEGAVTKYWVNPEKGKTLKDVTKPSVTPAEGYKHTGWDKADTEAIGKGGLTVTAQYKAKVVTTDPQDKENYAHVTFATTKGTVSGTKEYWVLKNEKVTFTVPTVDLTGVTDYTFKAWNPVVAESYAKDTVHNATFNYTGSDIVPQPGNDKPDVPDNFVLVEFLPGDHGTLTGTTKYWVNPEAGKTLADVDKPTVSPEGNWTHTGWDKEETTAITGALKVKAEYSQNPSIVANPVQKYDEAKNDQYIEGVLPEGKTLPADATVKLVVKNGDKYEEVDVPVTREGGVIKVDVNNNKIQHGGTYYFAITENGKTTSYSDTPVTIDKQGPSMGTAGEEITLVQDAYGYQVKISAEAKDDAGILRVYAETDKEHGYYKEGASETTATLSESIQNQLGAGKTFTVTAVDKFGNKTTVTKTAEATKTPIMIKAERPLDGDDFIYVTTDKGASLVITVINKDKSVALTMTHIQTAPSEEIKLVGTDGTPFKLSKGQRVKVKASLEGKENNTLTIRVR